MMTKYKRIVISSQQNDTMCDFTNTNGDQTKKNGGRMGI